MPVKAKMIESPHGKLTVTSEISNPGESRNIWISARLESRTNGKDVIYEVSYKTCEVWGLCYNVFAYNHEKMYDLADETPSIARDAETAYVCYALISHGKFYNVNLVLARKKDAT